MFDFTFLLLGFKAITALIAKLPVGLMKMLLFLIHV